MPGASLPLHVFEMRYRALVTHCLAGDRIMGIATLKPGYESGYEGKPDIWPEIGIGEIIAHQPFADGRSNIVLRSIGRGILAEELPSPHLFRLVRCELRPLDESAAPAALSRLRMLVMQLGTLSASAKAEVERLVQLDSAALVDAVARRLLDDPDEQRAYLGATSLISRAQIISERLAGFIKADAPAEG